MTIEQINAIQDIAERIKVLKKRATKAPDTTQNREDWEYGKHQIFDQEVRPKRRVLVKDAIENHDGTIRIPAQYQLKEVNRIAIPLEQDIVNIHTAFTVGIEPSIECDAEGENEQVLLDIVQKIFKANKIKYSNKKIVRSWLSECEVAEYWYTMPDNGWWEKIIDNNTQTKPKKKLKSVIWSPFRGDKLYPYFDPYGDLIAFSRAYTVQKEGKTIDKLMVIDHKHVTIYAENEVEQHYQHGFDKIPIVYMYREQPYCHMIRTIRERLETLMSNFADCLDYNFFPKLTAKGIVEDIKNRGTGSEIIQLENGAEISYLTWQQSPEMAKMELENLTEQAYALTNTPRLSFEQLRGAGNALSGRAFKFMFMGTHMQVSNHAEVVEEFLQRRINFLLSAISILYPKMSKTATQIEISTSIIPYMIENLSEQITDAVNALQGGVASQRQGILMAGITDAVQEEMEQIAEEEKNRSEQRSSFAL